MSVDCGFSVSGLECVSANSAETTHLRATYDKQPWKTVSNEGGQAIFLLGFDETHEVVFFIIDRFTVPTKCRIANLRVDIMKNILKCLKGSGGWAVD
jgi:hypothetical protein